MEKVILKDEELNPRLHLIKTPDGIRPGEDKPLGNSGELTIGRGNGNDWILKDSQRFLSVRHCRIFCEAQNLYLVDLSTNGTFLNDARTPIGRGARAVLNDGDRIRIGQYCFEVKSPPGSRKVATSAPMEAFADGIETDLMMQFTPAELELLGPEYVEPLHYESFTPYDTGAQGSLTGQINEQHHAIDLAAVDQGLRKTNLTEPMSYGPMHDAWSEPDYDHSAQKVAADWNETSLAHDKLKNKSDPVNKPTPYRENVSALTPSANPGAPERRKQADTVPLLTKRLASMDACLLRALNLNGIAGEPLARAETVQKVVMVLREALTGVQRLIRLRNKTRKALRLNVTTIKHKNNNPFQFSVSLDELLRNLLLANEPGYSDPIDALRETFDALANHEAALLVGFQASQRALLSKFDPETMAHVLAEQTTGLFGTSATQRRILNAYQRQYQQIAREVGRFQQGFDPEFVSAYEKVFAKLAGHRAK